jgi:hypothetical protein
MDVGKCPECGTEVTARTLAKRPRGYRRRRVIRWTVIVVALIGVPYGGYRFWRDVNWPAWLPNNVLMWGMTWGSDRIDGELLRRCKNQTLSEDEIRRIYDYAYEPRLVYPEEIPAGTAVPAMVQLRWRGVLRRVVYGYNYGCMGRDTWEIRIGDCTVSVPDRPSSFAGDEQGERVFFDIPPLPPGERTVTTRGCFWEVDLTRQARQPGPKREFDLAGSLRVTDRPMDDYVKDVWEPALAGVVKAKVLAHVYVSVASDPSVTVHFADLPFPYAFEVYMRVSGQEEYEAVDGGFGLPYRWAVGDGANWGAQFPLGSDLVTDEGATIDMQLRPSRALALSRGFDACFGGVIEWLGLQPGRRQDYIFMRRPDGTFGPVLEPAPSVLPVAPTRVFRWEGGD